MIVQNLEKYNNEINTLLKKAYLPYKTIYKIKEGAGNSNFKYKTISYIEAGKVVATLSYYTDGSILRLFKIAVDPRFQGKGYCKKLFNYIDDKFKNHMFTNLGLYTIKETGSYKYFEKLGYNIISTKEATFATTLSGLPVYELEMLKSFN